MRNTYQIYIFKIYIPVFETWNYADLNLDEDKISKCVYVCVCELSACSTLNKILDKCI